MRKRLKKKLDKLTGFVPGQRIPLELSDRVLADLTRRAVESCLAPSEPFVLEILPPRDQDYSFLRLFETMDKRPLSFAFVNPRYAQNAEERNLSKTLECAKCGLNTEGDVKAALNTLKVED